MATLELDSITKTFQDGDDEIVAVDDISMSIDDGEFLVVVGPSGCGKSTTLRMIAGLETITSGTISLGDRVINDVASQDRDIAMVFQSYALYPH
ncbi:putative sugar ABC transporter ATP-binding protein, partial [Haloferax sp. BAB-2207]